jgi:UDP-N-acetyl-D-glucosamine dehydrogenase
VSYRRDIGDYRESPAIKVLELLHRAGANVTYHDSFVPQLEEGHGVHTPDGEPWISVPLTDDAIAAADAVVVLTDHSDVDYQHVLEKCSLMVDFRNVLPAVDDERLHRL